MMQKMKKISLMACSLLASAALVGGVCALPAAQSVSAETTASFVSVDTETKSAWEDAGYGTDGYLLLGAQAKAYSDMYTETDGNDGTAELSLYRKGNGFIYYDSTEKLADSTAPISTFLVNGSFKWETYSDVTAFPYLYKPDTESPYPIRLYNNMNGCYNDLGVGFVLRETEKIRVSAYILEWQKKVSESTPITVGLYQYKNIEGEYGLRGQTTNAFTSGIQKTMEEHYGTPLAETTITSQGAYVTFEIEGAGNYQIVAYYDNEGTSTAPIRPMPAGLFFDKVKAEEEPEVPNTGFQPTTPVAPTEKVLVDTTSKSAWEANGYGTDGYLVFGGQKTYSDMYTEQGNDGKTEISLYVKGNRSVYYDATEKSTDSTAPISGFVVNGSSEWKDGSEWTGSGGYFANQPDLYIPGTETGYPVRMHNNHNNDPYRAIGIGFTLRETEKIYVTAYVLDWSKAVSANKPITVGLFKNIQTNTSWGYDNDQDVFEDHYGTALLETTVTSQGAYVTFAIEGKGNYQIVAYHKNSDIATASPVTPMITGLFFDKEMCAEVTSTSLSLEGDIGVNYYVGAHGQDLTDAILQVEYPNGTFDQVSATSQNADGTYKFQVKVAAKDYAAKMKACLFTEDGTTLSRVFEYSAADYVASVLKAGASVYGEKLVALVTALDDYGKAAANLFYAQENTFTADLSSVTLDTLGDYQFALVGDLPTGVALTDFSLSLQSTTSLKIYFTATSLSGVVCKVDGTAVTPVKTGANEYCIEIENINAKDLDTNLVVSIGDCTLTLNTLSYAYRALEYSSNANLKTAMQALYLYNQAANVYFAKEA